jgi:hypothetical protein
LFTLILDSITASGESAVSSASVGSEVRVSWTIVALLVSFNDSITALSGNFEEVDWSAISGLEATSIVSLDSSELIQLAARDGNGGGEDEPLSSLFTRRRVSGARVLVNSGCSGEEGGEVD